MTLGATLIARRAEVDPSAMLRMAGRATGHCCRHLVLVMNRAVVAAEARAVQCVGRILTGLPHVARFALLLQYGVWLAHAAAGIDARITGEAAPGDPHKRQQR